MTRKADTLRPFLRCAAVVLCSLALPLAVFALWDRALLAAPHTRTDGERFSAAGRANATACTLYAAEHVYIQLIFSGDDAPLYFNYQNDLGQGDTLADDAVAQYCALLGLDEFTDWQYPDWGTAVRDFGAAGYSETAQVYAVANASGYSVTLSAASMTPQTFAALNTQYGEEIS